MRNILLGIVLSIVLPLHAQRWNWAVDAGGNGNTDFCFGIATDSHGNVYWAGSVSGLSADFGCGSINSNFVAGCLAKYDSTGACQWVRGITVNSYEVWAYSIAIDAQDRIYITGSYDGNATFSNGITLNSIGSDDIFLARYDTDGNCLWARRAGTGANDEARGVAVSPEGDVFITGFCGGNPITFDTISIANPSNWRQVVVARYDSTGAVQWAKASSSPFQFQPRTGRGISVANGRLYVTGQIGPQAATFDGLPITDGSIGTCLYVLACDLDGHALWAHAYGNGDVEGMGVAADTLGDLFVVGRMNGALQLPGDTLTSVSADDDIVVMGLDTAGYLRWARSTGSAQRDLAWGVEADGLGNAYIVGQFEQSADFFGVPINAVGEEDLFIARMTNWGQLTWVKPGGSFQRDVGLCIHRGKVGSHPIYAGGYFWGPVTYGSSTIDDVQNGDAMLIGASDTIAVDLPTSVVTNGLTDGTFLFPSPAGDRITVRAASTVVRAIAVSMTGATVPVVLDRDGQGDVHGLAPGLYVLRLQLADGRWAHRTFIKE